MKITNRIAHDCTQGSPEWHALRAGRFTASEAPAMLGVSKYMTRTELLRQKATGVSPEIDAGTQRRFDDGHAAEAAARPIVEQIIEEELFPITMTADLDGLPLLASMDGLTMLGEIGWETKLLNESLKADVQAGTLHEHYTAQMEQQLLVTGAQRIYFTTTDGTPENTFGMWYESDPVLRARLIAGWKQFSEDLASYTHSPEAAPAPAGRAPEALPALRIEVTGMVTASNLDAFREHALAVFGAIKTDLQTDADFADAEKTVKWAKEVEDKLDAAKSHALSQTTSIDKLFSTIDAIKDEARAVRLKLDKLVKAEKENRKVEIVRSAQQAIAAHVTALNQRIGGAYLPAINLTQFGEAIKGLKSLDSMRDKVAVALANAKIDANATADRIEANRKTVEDMSLFPDFAQVCAKAPDDFAALLAMRVQQRKEAQDRLLNAERERIRAEEQAKAQREAAERARAEAAERARVEYARREAEAFERARIEDGKRRAEAERLRAETAAAPEPVKVAAPVATIPADTGATITLGQINARLSPIALSKDGLASLGIHPSGRDRAAVLYRASDVPKICAALVAHLTAVQGGQCKEAV